MRIISAQDIEKVTPPKVWTDTMEQALLAADGKEYFTPGRMHVDMEENTLLLMPSVGPDMFSTKLVSVFPGNTKIDKQIIQGNVFLNDGKTGESLALINGSKLTAMRTAAVVAVGIRHIADKGVNCLGIIGAGVQGKHITWLASAERDIKKVFVFDKSEEKCSDFMQFLEERCPQLEVILSKDSKEVLEYSDIVVTATTSETPVIPADTDLITGKTFIGVGSYKPSVREFPETLYSIIDKVWIDAEQAVSESGDLIHPLRKKLLQESQIRKISDLIRDPELLGNCKTQFYKTVGMGIFDLFGARIVYRKACELNLGEEINI
jgi:ornithine cyclodeaminase/alanine dehydrogenase-like protein (mu-crystallin family)